MTYPEPPPRVPFQTPSDPTHVVMTLRLADASDDILIRQVRLLRDCVALAQQRWDFEIEAAAVLPNEMQLLCLFSDAEFCVRDAIKLICSTFERHLPSGSGRVWSDQGEVVEMSASAARLRRAYVEAAPVRAGLVKRASDWPYSSAHVGVVQSSELGVAVA